MSMLTDYQNAKCYLCGESMAPADDMFCHDTKMPSLDHVLPKSKGGLAKLGNVALAHKKCNNEKADRMPFACERMFAEQMAKCFEESHVQEPYQGFQTRTSENFHPDFRLHIRGKGFMYVRGPQGGTVMSRNHYRARLKREYLERRIA